MDGTTHRRTREIFEELSHPKLLKYEMPSNQGPYFAANRAFASAKTEYLFWLGGDDQLVPDSLALMRETIERYPDVGFVYGDLQRFGGDQKVWRHPHQVSPTELVEGHCLPGVGAFQKKLWKQLGGFSTELAKGNGDYDFHIGAVESGAMMRHCGEIIYRYRVGHPSVSSSYEHRYHETHEIMVRRHPVFFADRKLQDRFLAVGYRRSARAHYLSGNPRVASRFVWSAIRHGMWSDRRLWSMTLKGSLPAWGFRCLRRAWRLAQYVLGRKQRTAS